MDYSNLAKVRAAQEFISVEKIKSNGSKQIKEFHIDCSKLEDLTGQDIRLADNFRDMFNQLSEIVGPVVYVFEIISEFNSSQIVNCINTFSSDSLISKATPAIKKTLPESKILYVGKVKKKFSGRLYQHLGYYKVRGTQGLQLFHWAKPLNLQIKLTVIEFENDATEIISILENKFANRLKPLLGKHK